MSKQNSIKSYFECKICEYVTYKKYNYDKHLLTNKHQNAIILETKPETIKCNCSCISKKTPNISNIILDIIKQNQELKELIIEQNRKMIELLHIKPTIEITNNNCNNNYYNIDINDYVNAIPLPPIDAIDNEV